MCTTDPNISNLPALGAATVSIPDTGYRMLFYHHSKSLYRGVAYSLPLDGKVTGMGTGKLIATKSHVHCANRQWQGMP